MPVINELIRAEEDGTIAFGNYLLDAKSKVDNFEFDGDIYKVKSFKEITKLERNGLFVYESVPGTAVNKFKVSDKGLEFYVEGKKDAQITVELEEDTEYRIFIDDTNVGNMKTNLGGKLMLSVELGKVDNSFVRVIKL